MPASLGRLEQARLLPASLRVVSCIEAHHQLYGLVAMFLSYAMFIILFHTSRHVPITDVESIIYIICYTMVKLAKCTTNFEYH